MAKRAILYLAVFPTAFFFLAGYTESLFLALALGSLYAAYKQKWSWSVVMGMFTALTFARGAGHFAFDIYGVVSRYSSARSVRVAKHFSAVEYSDTTLTVLAAYSDPKFFAL